MDGLIFFAPSEQRESGLPKWWWELWRFLLTLEFKQIVDPVFNVLMVAGRALTPFSKNRADWAHSICTNTRDGETYRLDEFPRTDIVTLGDIVRGYAQHPEIKSLGPDGKNCNPHTRGLLRRMTIHGGLQHCIGKEVSRFDQGKGDFIENIDDVCMHYDGGRVAANKGLIAEISARGLRKTTRETGLDRKTIRGILTGEKVKKSTLAKVVRGLQSEQN